MANIILDCDGVLSFTCIPNIFIDKYMTAANGEYIKIYLYLLRHAAGCRTDLSVSALADVFEHTEKDVLRALTYWEKAGLLQISWNENGEPVHISCILPGSAVTADTASSNTASSAATVLSNAGTSVPQTDSADMVSAAETADVQTATPADSDSIAAAKKNSYSAEDLEQFQNDESVQEILFITENYLGHPLNSTEVRTILYWYDGLSFSADLIEYLIETCISNGHTSFRYMEKIALAWADEGIRSVAEARREHNLHSQDIYGVMKAFGITGRNLISSEIRFVEKWTGTYAFSMDIIREACRRTIQATGKASFEYTDTILTSWHKKQVKSVNDIVKLDAAHQKSRAAARSKDTAERRSVTANRFNNFPQREYNYDQLEKKLLNTTNA